MKLIRKLFGYAQIGVALGDQLQYRQFAGRQARQLSAIPRLHVFPCEVGAAGQDVGDGLAQAGEVFVLADETAGAGLEAQRRKMRRVLPAIHQQLLQWIACAQPAQQIETARPRQRHLEDDQPWSVLAGKQECRRHVGRLGDAGEAHALQQVAQCAAHDGCRVDKEHRDHSLPPS